MGRQNLWVRSLYHFPWALARLLLSCAARVAPENPALHRLPRTDSWTRRGARKPMPPARLPISSLSYEEPVVVMLDWSRIEQRYVAIPSRARHRILGATQTFSDFAMHEAAALPLSLARVRLDKKTKSAKAFWYCCQNELIGGSDDVIYISHLLRSNLDDSRVPTGVDALRFIRGLMTSMVSACERSQLQLTGGMDCAWHGWILELGTICEQNGLPTGVRKDFVDIQRCSPFVALVHELQSDLPQEIRRYEKSYDSLAQAIQRVRRKARSERQSGKRRCR
jgi:hypothetical protein